jgi:hypothetical protein
MEKHQGHVVDAAPNLADKDPKDDDATMLPCIHASISIAGLVLNLNVEEGKQPPTISRKTDSKWPW